MTLNMDLSWGTRCLQDLAEKVVGPRSFETGLRGFGLPGERGLGKPYRNDPSFALSCWKFSEVFGSFWKKSRAFDGLWMLCVVIAFLLGSWRLYKMLGCRLTFFKVFGGLLSVF